MSNIAPLPALYGMRAMMRDQMRRHPPRTVDHKRAAEIVDKLTRAILARLAILEP